MKIVILSILAYTFFVSAVIAQNDLIGSWKLIPNQISIEDATGNFQLTKNVSTSDGLISGHAESYLSSLDLRGNSFSLEGYFKTSGKTSSIMAIAGNRTGMSGYTGWDFMMDKDGRLRFFVNDNSNKRKTLFSSHAFNDGEEHHFRISWEADSGSMIMVIDKKNKNSTRWDNDLGENDGRLFYIGAQPISERAKVLPFVGQLRDFEFRGTLDKSSQKNTHSPASLEKMDRELARAKVEAPEILWIDAKTLTIEGMGWKEGIAEYTRLPDKYKSVVTSKVWALSRHSAGITVRFEVKGTNMISARWILNGNGYMAHMTPQAVNGLDLYVKLDGKWVWMGVGKPAKDKLNQETILKGGLSKGITYECMVYLPLYSGISSLELGLTPGAIATRVAPNPKKPFVFYGTSILHGCSASRAGMSFSSLLGRKFDTPVVNLGFSGNGLMEEYFGDIMGEVEASVYFIDCLPNMASFTQQDIIDRTLKLVRKIHSSHRGVPIVLVEDRSYAYPNLGSVPVENQRRLALKAAYEILIMEMPNLYYVEGDQLLGEDTEATVDGSHPSDLGMYRYFEALCPIVNSVIAETQKQ